MIVEAGKILLELVALTTWIYASYYFLQVAEEIYGGRFTTALPYFAASYILFTLINFVEPIYQYLLISTEQYLPTLIFSLQTVQIVGGVLLMKGFYETYNMNFGAEGFEEVLDSE